jgi:hypothetical protein
MVDSNLTLSPTLHPYVENLNKFWPVRPLRRALANLSGQFLDKTPDRFALFI